MRFAFDPEKEAINIGKHGLNFDAAPLLFEGPFVEEVDSRFDYGETRFVAIGPVAEFWRPHLCCGIYVARQYSSDHQLQESQ